MKMSRVRSAGSTSGRWVFALIAAAGMAASASADVKFRDGTVLNGPPQAPEAKSRVLADLQTQGRAHALLRFDGPVSAAQRQELADSGITLLDYAGGFAYFAAVDHTRVPRAGANLRAATAVHAVDASWKLHPQLQGGKAPAYTIVGVERGSDDKTQPITDTLVAVNVLFHRDIDAAGKGTEAVRAVGGEVQTRLRSVNAVVAFVPESRIAELAKQDAVLYLEPPIPALTELNAENRVITQVDTVQAAPYGLDGTGVTAFIYDGGSVFTGHPDHSARVTVIDSDGVSDHATHVMGTVGGDGSLSGGVNRGMAPNVTLLSAGFEFSGGGTFLYTNPGDIEDDYSNAFENFNADISNNSIGSNVEPNGFNCAWQGDYGLTSSVIDSVVRGGLTGSPLRVVWAAGNERTGSRCDIEGFGDYMSVPPPSGAKNHVSVGALNSNDDSMTGFSSWGPTDDGRLIPTISAPGCQSGADNGVTSTSSSGGYNVKCGTSMASPTVTGIGALIIQDYRANFPDLPLFRNSFLKALLAHTANDNGNAGPDYQFGYGSVRAQAAIDQLRTGNFTEDVVDQGGTHSVVVVVAPGDPQLKVTMAWDDAPGTPLAAAALVNDLDLVVTSPSGTRFYPWTLDPSNPSAPATRVMPDRVNNIEQVLVDSPEPGGWTVEIVGFNVPEGPQPFSLVASPFLVNCSDQGSVRMNSDLFACTGEVTLRVVDCGLNTSDATIETVDVLVASDSNPAGVIITLTETAAESATFLGALTIADNGTGDLLISAGDTITATYEDTDDGSGSPATATDTASVDCTPPLIAGVAVSDIEPRSAVVTFMTDEPAAAIVRWGTSCGSWDNEVMTSALTTDHSIELTGLMDDTAYFFEIEAVDGAGNFDFDDNSGACYTFSTPQIPDFFTEQFSSGGDLDGKRIEFTPSGTIDFYAPCVEEVLALPVPVTGATNLGLGDDTAQLVTLTGGETVSLYGVTYSSFHVGPNGYLTFTAADSDWTESFADHFDLPRISLAFDDLAPNQGGAVLFEQLADRAVVTFDAVRERGASTTVTGQIELFFDGRIAITWLDVQVSDFIAGLSDGTGVDPDFFVSDLSSYASCGPRPPFAGFVSAAADSGSSVEFDLSATDDGLPGGPLTYTVTQLPTSGVLADVAGGLISSVPYTLAAGNTTLRYAPAPGYEGPDEVRFTASDGGSAPEGGDSLNTGTVSITTGGPQPIYEFLNDDSDPLWTTTGAWAFGTPTGATGSAGGPDPVSGYTGSNVYGYNLTGGYSNSQPAFALTTDPMDLTGRSGVIVEFQRWLGVESAIYDDAAFQMTTNGSTWTTLWEHTGTSFTDSDWVLQSFEIPAADNQPAVAFRWIMGTTDGSVTYCGWNIDDVRVLAVAPAGISCPHDLNGDNRTDASDLASLLAGWGGVATGYLAGDLNGDGRVNADDLAALLAAWNPAGCK